MEQPTSIPGMIIPMFIPMALAIGMKYPPVGMIIPINPMTDKGLDSKMLGVRSALTVSAVFMSPDPAESKISWTPFSLNPSSG